MKFRQAHAWLARIPPPLVYIAAFLAGVAMQGLFPASFGGMSSAESLQVAGAALLAAGILLGPVNALMFLARGTTLNPTRAPQRFFTGGVYRITRNPMYIGLLLVYAGIALLHAQPWSLLLIAVPFAVVDRIYIPCEEQRLAAAFGEEYAAYCRRVRRWLGVIRQPG